MMLNDLPSELLIKILANVPARDIGSVSKVNPNFNQVSREEFLWILLALRDFRVKLTVTQEFSPRNFYQRVLYPYRGCLGLWHRQNLPHYSGLLRVGVSSDCLLFEELVPSPTVRGPLQCVEFLRITCSSNDGAAVIVNHNTLAMSDVVEVGIPEKNRGRLTILLPNIQDNTTEPSEWMKEKFLRLVFGEDNRNNYLATMRFMSTFRSRAEYFYSRLSANWKTNNSSTPIREGLYVGSYGVHGVEMISVTSPSNCVKGTIGRKVTGDPNVPFNEITFRVTSEECLDIPLEVQADVRRLIEFEDDPTYKLYEVCILIRLYCVNGIIHIRALTTIEIRFNYCVIFKGKIKFYVKSCELFEYATHSHFLAHRLQNRQARCRIFPSYLNVTTFSI